MWAAKKLKDTQKKLLAPSGKWIVKMLAVSYFYFSQEKKYFGKNRLRLGSQRYCKNIPNLDKNTVLNIIRSIDKKVQKGMHTKNQTYYHTVSR